MTDQVDCQFRARWELKGAHIHIVLFIRNRGQTTWQGCGTLIIGEDQFAAIAQAMPNVDFRGRDEE